MPAQQLAGFENNPLPAAEGNLIVIIATNKQRFWHPDAIPNGSASSGRRSSGYFNVRASGYNIAKTPIDSNGKCLAPFNRPNRSSTLSLSLSLGGIATVNRGKRRARIYVYIYIYRKRERVDIQCRIERLFLIARLTDYDHRLIASDDLKSDLRQRFASGGRMSHRSGYFGSV